MDVVFDNAHLLLKGLRITLQVSGMVLSIGTIIGVLGGLSLVYGKWPLRLLIRLYVDTIRGIPLLVLIFAIFYGFPVLGLRVAAVMAAVIALSIFCGAHVSEIVRGGINSIPRGQIDAGKAIGLTFPQQLRYVIFPQTISRIIPPWTNTAVEMVKASSLVSLVSVVDLMLSTQQIIGRTRETLLFYGVAALIYLVINFMISGLGMLLERRFSYA